MRVVRTILVLSSPMHGSDVDVVVSENRCDSSDYTWNIVVLESENCIHPARYALAEIVNIHDKGLDFEPIHRVIFNISGEEFIAKAKEYFKDNGIGLNGSDDGSQTFVVVTEGAEDVKVSLANPPHTLAVGSVQMMIDSLGLECDYIHGEDSVRKLATAGNTGVLVPAISKDTFFGTVEKEIS